MFQKVKWTYKKKDCARGERKRDRAIIVEESKLDNILIKGISEIQIVTFE